MPICKGCGAEIKWVKMRTGGNMPVDMNEIKIIRVAEDGKGEIIGGYAAHWSTCPKADNFRPRDKRRFK